VILILRTYLYMRHLVSLHFTNILRFKKQCGGGKALILLENVQMFLALKKNRLLKIEG